MGVFAATLGVARTSEDRAADLWGWMGVAMAAWTYVACFAAGLNGQYTLFAVDLVLGIVSSGLGTWVAIRPQPSPPRERAGVE